tara:strand:+ start:1340 stop:1738 length:399 start_codon:yes stop_codon:yes gene_type:complete
MLEQYNEALWFFTGVFTYRILSTLLTYGHMAEFVKSINEQMLRMLGSMATDIAFARHLKYTYLEETGATKEQVNEVKEIDERSFMIWRTMCIANMHLHCPKIYKNTIKFSDWKGAMEELEKIYKKELSAKKR